MFFLASELHMTVVELSRTLTQEEMIGWAAFYELKREENERSMDRARTSKGARTMSSR
jgi:hypothetical protein